jgi:hypothetical protein
VAIRRWGNSPLGGDDTIFVVATNGALPAATQYLPYSQSLAGFFTGGAPPYTYTILSQTGANGWGLSGSSLALSPGPANAETDTLVIQALDTYNHAASATVTVLVSANPLVPTWP